eukprot:734517-Karenia_brevis.AAC.1
MIPPERDDLNKRRQSSKIYSKFSPPLSGYQNYTPPTGWFPREEGIEDMPDVKHLLPEYHIKSLNHSAYEEGPNVCTHASYILNHVDIMNPIGNDDCGNGDITPNTTNTEPNQHLNEEHDVDM